MLKTILLLDGSEAMNSSSDYLPSYLLAMRPPLLAFTSQYLEATPLASLGVVVMRNGVADRLCPCTTNASGLVDTLERDYFLYGGAGATSLENGLRMALSELVDLKKVAALPKGQSDRTETGGNGPSPSTRHRSSSVAQLHIIIVSASVTFIDPTDVFRVIATMAAFGVGIDVVSLTGAVHVFEECARQTGGLLHCPMGFDHLMEIMYKLAVGRAGGAGVGRRRKRSRHEGSRPNAGAARGSTKEAAGTVMVPIGFPVYVTRGDTRYLACPQCHLIQTAIPSTCSLCKLLLCNVCLTYATFVSHNGLAPATTEVVPPGPMRTRKAVVGSSDPSALPEAARCDLCATRLTPASGKGAPHRCSACHGVRCSDCDAFVKESLGLCPGCVAAM